MEIKNRLFTTEEAAAYLDYSTGTLENWRVTKNGPKYYKPKGKIYYYQDDLDKWIKQESQKS